MLRTTVPETPIDKHGDARFWKHKVRVTKELPIPAPANNAFATQQRNKRKLCQFVAAAADSGHDVGTFRWSKNVSHSIQERLICPLGNAKSTVFSLPRIVPNVFAYRRKSHPELPLCHKSIRKRLHNNRVQGTAGRDVMRPPYQYA